MHFFLLQFNTNDSSIIKFILKLKQKSFFKFEKGPPSTVFELNGWGDDLIHDYLKAIEINGRVGVLYSNKDYGCEWDYDFRNKRFLAEDNTKFGVNIIVYAMGG